MKMWKRWKAVLLAGMMACTAVVASVPAIGTLNAQAEEDTNNDDWLHAVGSRLYDKDGNEVWLTGANWFGMNCTENSPHGLYAADINDFVENIANHGTALLLDERRTAGSKEHELLRQSGTLQKRRWQRPGKKQYGNLRHHYAEDEEIWH